jgi:hypothetical protein
LESQSEVAADVAEYPLNDMGIQGRKASIEEKNPD